MNAILIDATEVGLYTDVEEDVSAPDGARLALPYRECRVSTDRDRQADLRQLFLELVTGETTEFALWSRTGGSRC